MRAGYIGVEGGCWAGAFLRSFLSSVVGCIGSWVFGRWGSGLVGVAVCNTELLRWLWMARRILFPWPNFSAGHPSSSVPTQRRIKPRPQQGGRHITGAGIELLSISAIDMCLPLAVPWRAALCYAVLSWHHILTCHTRSCCPGDGACISCCYLFQKVLVGWDWVGPNFTFSVLPLRGSGAFRIISCGDHTCGQALPQPHVSACLFLGVLVHQ